MLGIISSLSLSLSLLRQQIATALCVSDFCQNAEEKFLGFFSPLEISKLTFWEMAMLIRFFFAILQPFKNNEDEKTQD